VTWLIVAAAAAALAVIAAGAIVWSKGRPFTTGDVFLASRLSRGNRLFPTQVAITPTSVVQYTPRWIGKQEESIHVAHISSVKIDTGVLLSDVLIETSGGASPIRCHGHSKQDAVRMKALIEAHQSAYYRTEGPPSRASVGSDPHGR
jgi:hypothetical protein